MAARTAAASRLFRIDHSSVSFTLRSCPAARSPLIAASAISLSTCCRILTLMALPIHAALTRVPMYQLALHDAHHTASLAGASLVARLDVDDALERSASDLVAVHIE